MKKFYILILILMSFLSGLSQAETAKTIEAILTDMEQTGKNIKDMAFDFTQEINYISTNEKMSVCGQVKHKKQNYIYIYQKNPEQYTYIDGKKITIYVPANKQAFVESWKDVVNSDIIITTIIGFSKNWKTFKKSHSIEMISENDKEYTLLTKPLDFKKSWTMNINIDKHTLLVNSAFFDNNNFTISVKMTNYKLNLGLNSAVFRFNPAKNIEVIQL